MKHLTISNVSATLLTLLTIVSLTACDPNTPQGPVDPQDSIPSSFPKKHLLEEFTGQSCGYCPGGMDAIRDFVENDSNWIIVLHHYGYAEDHFSVPGSKTITSTLGVNGAPSMCVNRAKTNYGNGNAIIFHPAYLANTSKSQFETTTYASIDISNTYDPATRELNVHVSGIVAKEDVPNLQLTVLVKESGMIDTQADNYMTFEGWKEFRHTNAVRAFLTAPKGELFGIVNNRYSEDYTITLNSKWVPENCMVVAFLSDAFKPVVQAEQRPVVPGTQGGADIQHGGITPVPVPDYYPEIDATTGPTQISDRKVETMGTADVYYQKYPSYNFIYWVIQAYDEQATVSVNNTTCIPFAEIYFFTDLNTATNTLPLGTYEFNDSFAAGSGYAGYRQDEPNQEIGGSMFYFTSLSYFQEGYLVPQAQWLIASGSLTISEDGWLVDGYARNGSRVRLSGTTLTLRGSANAPKKANKRSLIDLNGEEICK